jgi:3-hydroxybutyryl-CoA dehydrogenase
MTIERIAVIGAGTMGHGIAQSAAQAGYETVLCDLDEELVSRGLDKIRANLDRGIELGKADADEAEAALGRIRTTTELEDLAAADMVIEAIPEDLGLKQATFARLASLCAAETIFCTNTSSLSIAAIGADLADPGRLVGTHFFNPVHVMKLIEIVRHEATRDAVVAQAVAVGEAMGKTPIVVRDVPGFATSRLGVVLGLEAMRMVEQGVASARDIDTAMELGYRHPMGPLKLTDLVGLDVRLAIARYLHQELGSDAFRPPEILERMVAEGRLGKKSGRGFYDW